MISRRRGTHDHRRTVVAASMLVMTKKIDAAVTRLRAGELVAFPTETVYGLGADARNPVALRKVYALKGRPATHPLILHLHSVDELVSWAAEVPPMALRLAARFWPGPLTLVLRRAAGVADELTGGQDPIAVRVPAHPVRPLAAALRRRRRIAMDVSRRPVPHMCAKNFRKICWCLRAVIARSGWSRPSFLW